LAGVVDQVIGGIALDALLLIEVKTAATNFGRNAFSLKREFVVVATREADS